MGVSFEELFKLISEGGPDVVFLLMAFITMAMTGQIYYKREVGMRDAQIDRLTENNRRQQDLFESALKLIKEDIIPMVSQQRVR
jgi:hypothetical protein